MLLASKMSRLEDWMRPVNLTANRLATDLRVPSTRIGDIIRGRQGITADTALRLARYFGTSAAFWMGMQAQYDLKTAKDTLGKARRGRASIEALSVALLSWHRKRQR